MFDGLFTSRLYHPALFANMYQHDRVVPEAGSARFKVCEIARFGFGAQPSFLVEQRGRQEDFKKGANDWIR